MSAVLFLSRADVERLLTPEVCFLAVEQAFRALGEGTAPLPAVLAMHAERGSFHVKAGLLAANRPYFAAKLNANFPENGRRHGLPTIQGVVILSDATNGTPLAIMDSISITALRTAAASALAAKHLAQERCETLLICGCGGQAAAQLHALLHVRKPRRIYAFDLDHDRARAFAAAFAQMYPTEVAAISHLADGVQSSDLVVTCTTSTQPLITPEMVRPGTFVAAVGADSENKQEIDPRLLASAKVVTDLTEQACRIGDLHHAVAAGVMTASSVHAELGEIVASRKSGRETDEEIIVFDSTGTGLQDVAAAIAVYRRAIEEHAGTELALTEETAA